MCFAGYRGRLVGEGEITERSGVFRGIWAGGVSSISVYECRSSNLFMECKRQGVDCPCATCSRRRACDRHSDVTMLSHGELWTRPINAVAVHCATWRQTHILRVKICTVVFPPSQDSRSVFAPSHARCAGLVLMICCACASERVMHGRLTSSRRVVAHNPATASCTSW